MITDEQKAALNKFRAQCELQHILMGRVSPEKAVEIAKAVYAEYGLDWDEPTTATGRGDE